MARSVSGRKSLEWRRRLRRFHKSRQSIAAFCRQEGVSPPSFYLWRKRLQEACPERPAMKPPAGFRPVRIVPAAGVSVQLPGGTQLLVPLSDAEGLRVAIEALARVDAQHRGGAASC
jgi:transposase-like protein